MQLRYDDDFVEAAVFCASGRRPGVPALQIRRFHAEREKCYAVADPDERNAAFFRVHLGWFREWGLEQRIAGVLDEYPLLKEALHLLAFRQARGRNEEGAELYVSDVGVRNGVVAVSLPRWENDESLARWLRHEFMHLRDMVDPAFGYSPRINLASQGTSQQRIARERYRLLWDITIDGRIHAAGHAFAGQREQHQGLFDRAFSFWPEARRHELFESHWTDAAPRHDQLMALAADPRDLANASQSLPGGSCPLCHFPTFVWADVSALSPEVRATLQLQFPDWTPEQGVCQRCVEIYELAGRFEVPATMVL